MRDFAIERHFYCLLFSKLTYTDRYAYSATTISLSFGSSRSILRHFTLLWGVLKTEFLEHPIHLIQKPQHQIGMFLYRRHL